MPLCLRANFFHAREHHGRSGGDQAEGQLDEEGRRQIGLEEVHRAEQAEEDAEPGAVPRPKNGAHDDGIDQAVHEQGEEAVHVVKKPPVWNPFRPVSP